MGLIDWYASKRDSIIQDFLNNKNHLSSEWENFLKKETYLTSDLEEKFLEDYTKLFHWFFLINKKVRISSKDYNLFLEKLKLDVEDYNEQFIENRLKENKTFFDGKQHNLKPLDMLQRRAIVIDDKHNLVIAGAGAGKTAILTSKIAYLVNRPDKPKIKPNKILVLAFNNTAVEEIKKRIKDNFKIEDVNIETFHKLGRNIISNETKSLPSLFDNDGMKTKAEIKRIIDELLKDKQYQDLFLEYLSTQLEEEVSFEDEVEYYEYMRNKKYTTLKNDKVKSIAERDIANFLFTHNIKYEYEKEADWIKDNKQEYNPDFWLPEYDIYIEHWGMNKNNEVPEWFEGKNPSEKYLKDKGWKLKQFEKYNKTLVESWSYEREEGKLISNLMESINKVVKDIKFNRLSYEEIVKNTNSYKENSQEISDMICSFINIAKANDITFLKIKDRIHSKEYSERQKLFAKIALEVFIEYEKLLENTKKIDFNDMIIKATNLVNKNPKSYIDKFDYILIDEFQDISKPRLSLIKALLGCNPKTKLFCVGDDWQSIYGFAGSEVDYFINFQKEFKYCEEIPLKTNYRSSKWIVETSNQLISKNDNRTKKDISHNVEKSVIGSKTMVYVLPSSSIDDKKYRVDRAVEVIKQLLKKGVDAKEIMVLSRFNRILRDLRMFLELNEKIPIEDKNEKSKGITLCSVHRSKGLEAKYVIILDVVSGTYGFPSEIKDSSVFEIVRDKKKRGVFEEERRLFYVALTRSKEFIYIFTIKDNQSVFLQEINNFIEEIKI